MTLPKSSGLEELLNKYPDMREQVELEYEKYLEKQVLNVESDVGVQQIDDLPLCSEVECPINRVFQSTCCIEIPQGFRIISTNANISFSPRNIICTAEPFCTFDVGMIDSPCGPIQGGIIEVFQIRVTGTLLTTLSFPIDNQPSCPNNIRASHVCCVTEICLDNIVCLSTNPNVCINPCNSFISGGIASIVSNFPLSCGGGTALAFVFGELPSACV